jgi:hypothetical protein
MSTKVAKTPCEIIVWDILPVIRKELAKALVEVHGLTQRNAAKSLGLTEATISRYLSGKRAQVKLIDGRLSQEVRDAAERIMQGNIETAIMETCRLCHLLQDQGVLQKQANC